MNLFQKELITFQPSVNNWQEAIKIATQPLIENHYVVKEFPNELIKTTQELGPYYILSKNLALAHISPNGMALKNGISLLFLDQPIDFKEDGKHNVKFLFVLSAKDEISHLELLQQMAKLFGNNDFYQQFYDVKNFADIQTLIRKF